MAELSGPVACSQCGASVAADDPFCPKCGARQVAGLPAPADPLRAALERGLGAQYAVQRLLGRGGMGAVYLAREKALERAVAIKVLPPDAATDADSRERFRREARTAAKLTHPNIVPLYTFGDTEGMLYFVMGYVKGESLGERMRREGKLPEEDVRRILGEVADALHYAHKQGVVHRDIKPDNILLEDDTGRPMLTDFGVAKARASGATLTEAGAVVGTPYYMSPEQASGARDIDGRSDLYSLGVMGYAMLSGRLPFEGDSFRDVIVQHVTQEPAPLTALVPEAPRDLAEAVMRCLAKAPAQRWPDAQGLREAIGETGSSADSDPTAPGVNVRAAVANYTLLSAASALFGWASWLFPSIRVEGMAWWAPAALIIGVTALVGGGGSAVYERRQGLSWRTILRLAMQPPKWWTGWWPARWRLPGDVWDRLPPTLRLLKVTSSVLNASLPFAIAGALYVLAWMLYRPIEAEQLAVPVAIAYIALMGPLAIASIPFHRWARSKGLGFHERTVVAQSPTWKLDFWRKPKFAALLLPPPGRAITARPAEPRSPDEYARAIRDLVGQLPSGLQVTVSEAADAVSQLLDTVAALDAELAKLAQDADPQELEAVEAKLRALGPETPGEDDVRRQKRAVLVPQRELLRALNQRLAAVAERRARLVDLLRTMWLQVATLRAEAARDTLAVTEISGRVKALCADVDAHVRAAEAVNLLGSNGS